MKKAELNVDKLCVESFSTLSATSGQSGTIEAYEYSESRYRMGRRYLR